MTNTEIFLNPTVKKVVFQIQFSSLFSIENKIGEFQLKIMDRFPDSSLAITRQLFFADVGPDAKIEGIENKFEKDTGRKIWQFKSENDVKLNITYNSIDISSQSHKTYNFGDGEKFRDIIRFGVDAFYEEFKIPMINRIGLRYIDHGPLPEPLENQNFLEYYNTALPLARFNLKETSQMFARTVVKKGNYNLAYVENLDLKNQKLIMDFDAFAENVRFVDYLKITDELHDIIHDEYNNNSIKEPIREIMRRRS